jgi:hypothetical protein
MEAMPLIRSKVGRGLPLLEGLCFPTDKGVYCRRRGRARRLWCVPCLLAVHPAAVLLSCAWLRKDPHGVGAVAVQRKQGSA